METDVLISPVTDQLYGRTFLNFELPSMIQKIKKDCGWKMGDLKSAVIDDSPYKKIILTGIHAQTEIESVQNGDSVNIYVVEGSLKLTLKKEGIILGSSQKFTITDKIKYSIEALQESFYILTVIPKNATIKKLING